MLAGGTAPYFPVFPVVSEITVWGRLSPEERRTLLVGLLLSFPLAYQENTLTAISTERLHATFWLFRHRVVKTSIYRLVIAFVWVTAVLISVAATVFLKYEGVCSFFCTY